MSALSAACLENELVILVQTESAGEIRVKTYLNSSNEPHRSSAFSTLVDPTSLRMSSTEPNAPVEQEEIPDIRLAYNTDDVLLLSLDGEGWVSILPETMLLNGLDEVTLGIEDGSVSLFGIQRLPQDMTQLVQQPLPPPGESNYIPIDLSGAQSVHAFTVNQRPRLIVGQSPLYADRSEPPRRYYLGSHSSAGWQFVPLVDEDRSLSQTPTSSLAFAGLDQIVFALQMTSDELKVRSYSLDGEPLNPEPYIQPLGAPGTAPTRPWFIDYGLILPIVSVSMLIILARREDIFTLPLPTEPQIEPAPLWRRLGAFIADATPAYLITYGLTCYLFPEFIENTAQPSLSELLNGRTISTEAMNQMSLFYLAWVGITTAYYLFFELRYENTPGKAIFQLQVVTLEGRSPETPQRLARNLLRAMEMHPHQMILMIVLFLLAFTPKHQRLGDLLGRTFVARYRRPATRQTDKELEDLFDPEDKKNSN